MATYPCFTLCAKYHKGPRKWVNVRCRRLRLDKITEHNKNSRHANLSDSVTNITNKAGADTYNPIQDATKMLQFLVMKNLPLSLFGNLTTLCNAVGFETMYALRLAKNVTYINDDIVKELLPLLHR